MRGILEGVENRHFVKREKRNLRSIIFITWIVFLISFDYEDAGYQTAELVKMEILLNGNIVEELVTVVHK